MFYLHRHPDEHGNSPILVFWDGVTAVFVDRDLFLKQGHVHNGELITEPVPFSNVAQSAVVARNFLGKCRIVERDEVRDVAGKLITLEKKPLTIDVDPPPKQISFREDVIADVKGL